MKIETLRVMTFNIRHARGMDEQVNLQKIAAEIKQSGADIIALQEVDRFLSRSHLQDQPAELARLLNMNVCFSASEDCRNSSAVSAYIRENNARSGMDGAYGNAILSRFSIVAHRCYFLPGKRERRSLLQAEIAVNDDKIHFFSTHLSLDEVEQIAQMNILRDVLGSTPGAVALGGDFNMESANPLIAKLASVIHKVPLRDHATTFAGDENRIVEIDHLFTNLAAESGAWTQPTRASDHHPVLAQLQLS